MYSNPHEWSKGRIVSLHKKGDPTLASNYRGITISSVVGKLFNYVLNNRLCTYLDDNDILCPEQSGFRKKHRTTDHMFILKNIMNKYKHDNKPLYIAFVDFKQAFDTISHKYLLYKLLKNGVSSKLYNIIKSMYNNISLAVQSSDGDRITEYFISLLGVRQGDNLSPTLFNIFVNDIPKIFDYTCDPAIFGDISINCLMYADDLLILSETNLGLQNSMNKLSSYCNQWGLSVNTAKTKFMISKSNIASASKLLFNNEIIEQVFSFKYLGIEFSYDGNNLVSQTDIYKKGLKAYFKLIRSLNPPPTPAISLHLFDHLVKPILLYGCEIWSPIDLKYKSTINKQPMTNKTLFINQLRDKYPFITKHMDKIDPIEKLHLKFLKSILGVHSKATNLAVYGELGRYPLLIDSITRCMKYIQYIETETENKLLQQFYECLVDNQDLIKTCSLLTIEKQIKVHMNTRPVNQQCKSTGVFFKSLKKSLTSSFDNYWHEMLHNNESL